MYPSLRLDIVIGFSTLFMVVRAYGNSLMVEISYQLYGGFLRCISLGPTEGITTWKCSAYFIYQPVIVPVGKLALGRIFNVIGTQVDAYEELNISCTHISCANFYQNFLSIFSSLYTLLATDSRLVTRLATSGLLVSYPRDRINSRLYHKFG